MNISSIVKDIISGKQIDQLAAKFLASDKADLWELLHGANAIRQHFHQDKVHLCSIINAKSGACSEDCKFCAQSVHHNSQAEVYPLVSESEIRRGYRRSREIGAHGFSIVTSGNALDENEISGIADSIRRLSAEYPSDKGNPYICGSLGRMSKENILKLKSAGLNKAHHNLETSRRYFKQVCSTHSYDQRIETIRNLKAAGLRVCSGGIFGMGETWDDRIDMALALRELDVESIPLNFLIPIMGTLMQDAKPLTPQEILRIIAVYRYILPAKDIRICAGREKNLGDMQSWIFYAGATGMMIGGYLTQPGRKVEEDLQMLKSLGLKYEPQITQI
ncbi:MAG: biotin synthase BioB [Planctomycetota bacterium]